MKHLYLHYLWIVLIMICKKRSLFVLYAELLPLFKVFSIALVSTWSMKL